jgi:hypothetical protein
MKNDILRAYAEWHDREGCFAVFLAREDEDGHEDVDHSTPLRQFGHCIGVTGADPVEARLAWAASIHCPKDLAGCGAQDVFLRFAKEAQAKRVASRANKELAAYRKGKPVLEGTGAQIVYMMAGGKGKIGFSIERLRGKIAGT